MGYNPRADWHHATSPLPQVTLRLDQFEEAREQACSLMIKAQESWVKHKDTPKYKEGDLVWLEGRNLCLSQPMPKLVPRRHGPFKVVQVMSPVNYRLELPTQWSIHPVFHIDLLMPYRETIMHGANYLRPPPNLVDNEEEKNTKLKRFWTLGNLGSVNGCNIWLNGRDTLTWITGGSIRMTSLLMTRFGSSKL